MATTLNGDMLIQFNCISTEEVFVWRVNNTIPSVNNELAKRGVIIGAVETIIGSGMFSSSLFIPARSDNNNTSMRCSAIDANSDPIVSASSKVIFLNIQGLLDPPPNIARSETYDRLGRILRWDVPDLETLDITDIDPTLIRPA